MAGFAGLGLFFAVAILNGGHGRGTVRLADNMPVQAGWATPQANPVLPAGSLRAQALWGDPCVLKIGAQYIMYMTTSIDTPFQAPIVPFRAVSADGVNWQLSPPTPVALPGGTDFISIETPSVVQFQGAYHMFFTGIYPAGGPAMMAIGHAVSPDGISWKVSPGPVISATGKPADWNGVLVGEPGAIVQGNQIFVYFSALAARPSGVPAQLQTIGLAISSDGEHFASAKQVLTQSALFPPSEGFAGYSAPAAFELNGQLHLVYDVVMSLPDANPQWQQVAIQHAVSSTDGTGGFVEDSRPIFTRYSFPLSQGEVIGPAALVDDGKVKLWFAGHVPVADLGPLVRANFSGPDFGIYYATHEAATLAK
jgi:hypothetical protein